MSADHTAHRRYPCRKRNLHGFWFWSRLLVQSSLEIMRTMRSFWPVLVLAGMVSCDSFTDEASVTQALFDSGRADRIDEVVVSSDGLIVAFGVTNVPFSAHFYDGNPLVLRISRDGSIQDTTILNHVRRGRFIDAGIVGGSVVALAVQHVNPEHSRLIVLRVEDNGTVHEICKIEGSGRGFLVATRQGPAVMANFGSQGSTLFDHSCEALWTYEHQVDDAVVDEALEAINTLSREGAVKLDMTGTVLSVTSLDMLDVATKLAVRDEHVYVVGRSGSEIVVVEISSDGTVKERNAYGSGISWPQAITPLRAGGLALAYTTRERSSIVVRVDADGDVNWRRRFGQNGDFSNVRTLIELPDGRLSAAGFISDDLAPSAGEDSDALVEIYE